MNIRTRFAPSPTGFLHIGGLRTAVYAFALAKHSDGQFLLRIEDTDQKREVVGSTEKIYEVLKTFGLHWDELYIQSERVKTGIYQKAAEKMLADGHAFYCFCKPKAKEEIKEDQKELKIELRDPCRQLSEDEIKAKIASGEKPAIRLKVPDDEIVEFTDFVLQKKISWHTKTVDDAMLLKSDGFPTYHLAVVVDDVDMKVTHVIRGHDWMPSTPIHLLVYKYLGYELPQIGHPTDILDPEGGKLSKRKGNVSCEQFIAAGYLPEAILNFVILLGWAPKDNREMYTLSDFVTSFDVNGFQRSNPMFNIAKMNWFNQQYIKSLETSELTSRIKNYTSRTAQEIEKVLPLIKDRLVTLVDFNELTNYFFEKPKIDPEALTKIAFDPKKVVGHALETLQINWDGKVLEEQARAWCTDNNVKVGDYFMSLRVAITGRAQTPPLWEVMEIIGKDEAIKRLSDF